MVLIARLGSGGSAEVRALFRRERAALGRWSPAQVRIAALFAATALLWVTREPIAIEGRSYGGWSRWLANPALVSDATVAIAAAVLCFVIPAGVPGGGTRDKLLDWETAQRATPWGLLLLFGGGLALGEALFRSGVSQALGDWLAAALGGWPTLGTLAAIGALSVFVSEFMSNTATANVLVPIFGALAPALSLHPAPPMLAAALGASCGFMMPAGTGPNAIVFGTGRIPIRTFVARGFWVDLLCIGVLALYLRYVAPALLGVPLLAR